MAHAWPLDSTDGITPTYTGRSLRLAQVSPFLAGATADRPFGVHSGVRPGTSPDTVTVSGSTWTVHPCAGVIDPHLSASAGPYSWAVAEPESGTVPAASQVYTRWDQVYLVIDDPAETDSEVTPTARIEYRVGEPAATPARPTAPERSLLLARIIVPPAGAAPSVVWEALYLAAASAPIRVRSTTEANLLVSTLGASKENPLWVEHVGDSNTANGQMWRHDGTGWSVQPVLTSSQAKRIVGPMGGTFTRVLTAGSGSFTQSFGPFAVQSTVLVQNGDAGAQNSMYVVGTALANLVPSTGSTVTIRYAGAGAGSARFNWIAVPYGS
jgi:hypothetical protein